MVRGVALEASGKAPGLAFEAGGSGTAFLVGGERPGGFGLQSGSAAGQAGRSCARRPCLFVLERGAFLPLPIWSIYIRIT